MDGGFTYPYILASNTTNDGTETIVIPSATTQQGRIMVKSKGNIFFDINTGVITIASACGAQGAIVAPATSVTATAGNAILNLGLSPQYSTPLSIAGTLETTDPASSLAITDSATGACLNASNVMKYDSYTFTPSATATYTFTLTGVFPTIMNLYSGSFNGSASCNNLLKSNGLYTGTTVRIGSSISFALTVGSTYTLILGTFSITQPVLPAAYSIAITGGTIYSGTAIYFNPGATFNYTYVIVNTATNIIKGISTTANLTNSTTYPAGTYSVYGLSYANTITNLSTYVGQNLSVLQNLIFSSPSTFCGNFSKNIVSVTITAAPVPITLLSLTGKKVNDKVVLNWSTSSEQNASHFNIMRSRDGRNFTSNLGKVSASGNSNTLKNYTFTDALPLQKWNYYRLEQVDISSDKKLSNTVAIEFDKYGNLIVLYPNPADNELHIEYNSASSGNVTIQIFDSKGSKVLTRNESIAEGKYTHSLNIAHLSPGIYMLQYLQPNGTAYNVKFTKK